MLRASQWQQKQQPNKDEAIVEILWFDKLCQDLISERKRTIMLLGAQVDGAQNHISNMSKTASEAINFSMKQITEVKQKNLTETTQVVLSPSQRAVVT